MRLIWILILAILLILLNGCSNALYFYETEKIALSLEGRPDSSQPVQGSLGLKQRVAVVAPPKDPDTKIQALDEAISMLSSFRFRKDAGGFLDLGPVTIQTALVTGSAAAGLEEGQTKKVAPVVANARTVGADTQDIHARKKRLTDCVNGIQDKGKLEAIAGILDVAPNIDNSDGTKTSIVSRIGDLTPLELQGLEQSEPLNSCPQ
jgi:hypothetical protein